MSFRVILREQAGLVTDSLEVKSLCQVTVISQLWVSCSHTGAHLV